MSEYNEEPQEVQELGPTVLKGSISTFENNAVDNKGLIYYGFGGGDKHQIYGSTVFNTIDGENKHIEALKLEFQGEIAPHLKYSSNINAYNMFDRVDGGEVYHNSYIYTDIVPNHKIYFGQAKLSHNEGNTLNFIADMENSNGLNDIGVKIGGDHDILNYSIGAYNSPDTNSETNSIATGGTIAIKPFSMTDKLGELQIGTGYYSKQQQEMIQSTYGLFSGYNFKFISLRGEVARKQDSLSQLPTDSFHFSNSLRVTPNLNFITKFNQVLETQEQKNDFAIEYKAGKNSIIKIDHLRFELSASQIKDSTYDGRRRYGFKTKYLF